MANWIIRYEGKEHVSPELPAGLEALRELISCSGPIEILYQAGDAEPTPMATISADNVLYRTPHPLPKSTDATVFFMHSSIGVSHIVDHLFLASQDGVDNLQMKNTLIVSVVDLPYNWNALKDWYDEYQIFTLLHHAENDGKNIVIHCQHGCQRSPCIMAIYLIQSGKVQNYQEVFQLITRQRPAAKLISGLKPGLLSVHPLNVEARENVVRETPITKHSLNVEAREDVIRETPITKHLSESQKQKVASLIADYTDHKSLLFSKRRKDKKEFLEDLSKLPELTNDRIDELRRAHPKAFKGKKSRVEELVREIQSDLIPKK